MYLFFHKLKFLTQDEVEVASTAFALYLVETVGPVDTHQTNHRQEDAHTHTGRTFQLEGVEILELGPGITALDKGQP